MMSDIRTDMTIGDVAARWPQTRAVLERFGLDYCCGGDRKLGDALEEADSSCDEVLSALEEAASAQPTGEEERSWVEASATELADHIEERHHTFMRQQLPRIADLLDTVIAAHGEAHGDMLRALRGTYDGLRSEIEMHLMKEEQVLFPYIRQVERYVEEGGTRPQIHCITVQNPVTQMRHEHENAAQALEQMRALTDDYALPDDACAKFAALYDALNAVEKDLHRHIHLENNILFPQAVELEQKAGGGSALPHCSCH